MICPFLLVTVLSISSFRVPALLISIELVAAELVAAPPIWNVLIVNCVPGSPIDWAAITPTASPMLIL